MSTCGGIELKFELYKYIHDSSEPPSQAPSSVMSLVAQDEGAATAADSDQTPNVHRKSSKKQKVDMYRPGMDLFPGSKRKRRIAKTRS